jgi:hypothetical protein
VKEAAMDANGEVKGEANEATANGIAVHNGKVEENGDVVALKGSSEGTQESTQNGNEDHGITPKKALVVSEEGAKEEGESKEIVEEVPAGEADAMIDLEPVKDLQAEKPAPMSLSAHLVALWNKVASELSATNLTPGEIIDGARFLLGLPPVNLGSSGVGGVKDGIFEFHQYNVKT